MSAPVLTSLGPSTVNRKWVYEINIGTTAAPNFLACGGVTNSQFQPDNPNWVDNTQQAGRGFKSQNKTGADWSGSLTLERAVGKIDPTTYDVVQEYLRTKAIAKFGPQNTIEIRVFEYDPNDPNGVSSPRIEAYHGFCGVSWVPAGGDMMADDTVAVSFVAQGALDIIAHPYPAAGSSPVVTSATSPLATAGGTQMRITGSGFNGATAVMVAGNAVPAGNFTVVNNALIYATAPAHAAGAGLPVVVTNAVGSSNGGATVTYQ